MGRSQNLTDSSLEFKDGCLNFGKKFIINHRKQKISHHFVKISKKEEQTLWSPIQLIYILS